MTRGAFARGPAAGALLAPLLLVACKGAGPPPHIDGFLADNANPMPGAEVHLSYSVSNAQSVSISPEPGPVTASPVTVRPLEPTVYTLRAANRSGAVTAQLRVDARNPGPASILGFSLAPSQAPAGTPRTLTWKVHNGVRLTLQRGASAAVPVDSEGQSSEAPSDTTTYTLLATSSPGLQPGQVTARAVARVVPAASITSLTATPASLLQGDSTTLSWDGAASSWSVAANGATLQLGPARSLVVRPQATTTYSLTGTGPGGAAGPRQITVTVAPRPSSALLYTKPVVTSEKLVLDSSCAAPCSAPALTLRLVAASAVALRGVAIDLPLDATKFSLDPATFAAPSFDAGKAVLGSGPLQGALVLGAALFGSGTAPAADRSFAAGAELAHFTVALQPAGGQGIVFDGAAPFTAFILSASGRTPGGIAVGKLEAK